MCTKQFNINFALTYVNLECNFVVLEEIMKNQVLDRSNTVQ